jgi:hypothetical protein
MATSTIQTTTAAAGATQASTGRTTAGFGGDFNTFLMGLIPLRGRCGHRGLRYART